MFTSIKNVIPVIVERLGYQGDVEIYRVKKIWSKIMVDLYGEGVKKTNIKPLYLRNKTLFINCPDSVWANDLQMKKETILKKINKNSKKIINKIRFIY